MQTSMTSPRLTERAKRALFFAGEEAVRLGAPEIGTEMLLVGLLRDGESIAGRVLHKVGVDLPAVRDDSENSSASQTGPVSREEISYSPALQRVLELAVAEAEARHHKYLGTEHLLLGLLRETDGGAARVFERLGLDLAQTRGLITDYIDPLTA